MAEQKPITARIEETGASPFAVSIEVSGHRLTGDEPLEQDGGNMGPSPYDLLTAALGECTAMTVRWYARKNQWPLEKVEVRMVYRKEGKTDVFEKHVSLHGDSLTPEDDSAGAAGDDRRPARPMTDNWYLSNRIDGQITFYKKGQEKNENAYQRLQLSSFVAGAVIAAVSAIAAVYGAQIAAWTGALTTVGAAVGAYGLAERQKYLAASYAAMKANLERLKERYLVGGVSLQFLVATAEDLMESEHAAWIDQMAKTIRPQPSPDPQGGSS